VSVGVEERDASFFRRLQRIHSGPADVVARARGNHRRAAGSGFGHCESGHEAGRHLAPRPMAVDERRRGSLADDRWPLPGLHFARPHVLGVLRKPDHAVRVVACEVRAHQVVGDLGRGLRRSPERGDDFPSESEELGGLDARHGRGFFVAGAPARPERPHYSPGARPAARPFSMESG
jgi:hypothetical protein